MYDQLMFWGAIAAGCIVFFFAGYYLVNMNKTVCTRCTKKIPKEQSIKFLGVAVMCEPCENIASHYNQFQ